MAKRHTLTGFKTYYRPPVSWLIPGLIKRGGLGFFGGEPKSFKSVLMREIAVCGAAGGGEEDARVLGHFEVPEAFRVLLISQEDPDNEIDASLTRIMRAKNLHPEIVSRDEKIEGQATPVEIDSKDWNPDYLSIIANERLDYEELARHVEEFRPDLVLPDTLAKLLDRAMKMRNYDEVDHHLNNLREIRNVYGCAIIGSHHFNKQSEGRGGARLIESQAFHAFSECSIYITKPQGFDWRKDWLKADREIKGGGLLPRFEFRMVDAEDEPYESHYRLPRAEADDHTGADKTPHADEDAVRQVLADEPLNTRGIAAALRKAGYKVSPARLQKLLKGMPDLDKDNRGTAGIFYSLKS